MTRTTYPDGSYVARDPDSGLYTAHPRKGIVLKDPATRLPLLLPERLAVRLLREHGYAREAGR